VAASRRAVVLCADDFGLTAGVSRAILELAGQGRLSATSAMTNRPWWPQFGPDLRAHHGIIGVGLHLTLTAGAPLGPMPRLARSGTLPGLRSLIAATRSPPALTEIRDEIERQLDRFEAVFGRPPDFVDGHQHVHALPGIRRQLLAVLQARGARSWLRDPSDRLSAILRRRVAVSKAVAVAALAFGFGRSAQAAGFDVNDGFSGFSRFDPRREAAADLERAFTALGPRPVVMCHPGQVDDELARVDPVVATRPREFAYLASQRFASFLAAQALTLVASPRS